MLNPKPTLGAQVAPSPPPPDDDTCLSQTYKARKENFVTKSGIDSTIVIDIN